MKHNCGGQRFGINYHLYMQIYWWVKSKQKLINILQYFTRLWVIYADVVFAIFGTKTSIINRFSVFKFTLEIENKAHNYEKCHQSLVLSEKNNQSFRYVLKIWYHNRQYKMNKLNKIVYWHFSFPQDFERFEKKIALGNGNS